MHDLGDRAGTDRFDLLTNPFQLLDELTARLSKCGSLPISGLFSFLIALDLPSAVGQRSDVFFVVEVGPESASDSTHGRTQPRDIDAVPD